MKSCVILSSASLLLIFLLCTVGCDAGKPRNTAPRNAPVADDPSLVIADEPAEPVAEPQRELVAIGENVTGKADFAKDGDKHIMAPILVPLGEYFKISEHIVFRMQIPEAMKLYRAEHDNKPPATHDEFMKDIINANQIELPKLRNPDDKYQYDPESGELMISTIKSK
ncbi:MAG: hypothetical protein FWC43_11940 [Planctomycetaceae bacterium]|nr:hypothetical protein [Planctomycetaceae bacterium]